MGVTTSGRGASRQIWDEPKSHAPVRFSPYCSGGTKAPGDAWEMYVGFGWEMWAGDRDLGWGWGEGLECRQASPPHFFFGWKTSLLRLCFFPSLFKFIWENFPGCSQRCHQPDSLCCSNKMAP